MATSITADNWRNYAACGQDSGYDPETWFPVGVAGPALLQAQEAKRVCREECPVRSSCLVWALNTKQEFGIAGGLDEDERRLLRRNERRRNRVLAEMAAAAETVESEQVA